MRNKLSLFTILIIFFAIVSIKIGDSNLGKNGNYGVVDWDNFGYYTYLPAYFIYDDLKLHEVEWVGEVQRNYELSSSFYQAHYIANGNRVIQYTSGMAIIYSPAFFIGHGIAKLSDKYPADGFSKPYQVSLLVECILIVLLGLYFLRKLSLSFFSDKLTAVIILILCLGTNYFQIASANISSPHVILFCFYAILLYLTHKWHQEQKLKYSLLIGFFSALMILSRPNELLFLIIPLLWLGGDFLTYGQKLKFFLKNKKHLLLIILPLALLGSLQPLYWNYVTGEWLFDSYKNEDFKFLNPYLIEYLFSYKKGWLLYTPIMIFAILGFIPFYKKKKNIARAIIFFFIVNLWVLSSWDCWWYADSFSQRSIVQSYAIFLFPLGYLLKYIKSQLKFLHLTSISIIGILILFNLFQVYQFYTYILHPQRMTKEYYWNVFGVTDKYEPNRELLDIDRAINYLPESTLPKHKVIYTEGFTNLNPGTFSFEGQTHLEEGGLILTQENPVSQKVRFAYKNICDTSYCYVITRIRFKSDFEASENPFGIEFNMIDSDNGKAYGYSYRGVENISWFQKESWSSMDLVVIPPFMRNEDDSIQLNLKLKGNKPALIDQFSIEILDPSHLPELKKETYYNDYHTLKRGNWTKPSKKVGFKGYEWIDSLSEYSSTGIIPIKDLKGKRKVKFSATVNMSKNNSESYAVLSVNKEGENLHYQSFLLQRKSEGWEVLSFQDKLPKNLPQDAELKAYLWNKSTNEVLIRDLKIEIE